MPGVAGNGQDELLLVLSGELQSPPDRVRLLGQPVGHLGPNGRRGLGVVAAP